MADQRTEYVVLKFPPAVEVAPNTSSSGVPQRRGLQVVGTVKAANADFAIREVAEGAGAGQYVAVPARSWVPRTVEIETRTAVTFAKESV